MADCKVMNKLPSSGRKNLPLVSGVLDFFPNAIVEVSKVSVAGAAQRGSDTLIYDESVTPEYHADCLLRHLIDKGNHDTDGVRHSAKVAWRALALLQSEIELERKTNVDQ